MFFIDKCVVMLVKLVHPIIEFLKLTVRFYRRTWRMCVVSVAAVTRWWFARTGTAIILLFVPTVFRLTRIKSLCRNNSKGKRRSFSFLIAEEIFVDLVAFTISQTAPIASTASSAWRNISSVFIILFSIVVIAACSKGTVTASPFFVVLIVVICLNH